MKDKTERLRVEWLLRCNNFERTRNSKQYVELLRCSELAKRKKFSGEYENVLYFDKPVPFEQLEGFYICPFNPNLAVSNEKTIDINTMEEVNPSIYGDDEYSLLYYKGVIYQLCKIKAYSLLKVEQPIKHYFVVDHIDRNRKNDDISNLRFVSQSGNSVGQGNFVNHGKGIEIEVLDTHTDEVYKCYSLSELKKMTNVFTVTIKRLYHPLYRGAYKGRWIWMLRGDKYNSFEEVLDANAYVIYTVVDDNGKISKYYNNNIMMEKFLNEGERPTYGRINPKSVMDALSKYNPTLNVVCNVNHVASNVNKEGIIYKAYNPITKESIKDTSIFELGKRLGWERHLAHRSFLAGHTFINIHGYMVGKETDAFDTVTSYSVKLDKIIFDGDTYTSKHKLAKVIGCDRKAFNLPYGKYCHGGIINGKKLVIEYYEDKLKEAGVQYTSKT